MTKHRVVLYWSQADSLFVAEAPELPGLYGSWPISGSSPGKYSAGYGALG